MHTTFYCNVKDCFVIKLSTNQDAIHVKDSIANAKATLLNSFKEITNMELLLEFESTRPGVTFPCFRFFYFLLMGLCLLSS